MLQSERQRRILEQLKVKDAVKVKDLAEELGISESTIRRDISELDQIGKLKKVFGGAVSVSRDMIFGTTDVASRTLINVEEKASIAKYAAALIEDDDFVFLDAGTTTEKMIDYLARKNVTYVTNGVTHAKKLIQRGFSVYIIGGLLRPSTEAAVGTAAVDAIGQYNFSKCFMGANGVDLERGFTTPDISEAAVKTAVMKQSAEAYILADRTKFGRVSSVTFAALSDACIITDRIEHSVYGQQTAVYQAE